MKLIIQIPCFNETKTLPETIGDLPRAIGGVDEIEYLIIDDGSSDGTAAVARQLGVHHVVRFPKNRGLAKGFMAGLDACLRLGADIIVNTDADNQYAGQDISKLIQPLLKNEADMVVGDRQVETIAHFSETKKRLQKFGSWVVRLASGTVIPDATSGFRAISREAALRLFVTSEFTYTLETLIQAGQAHLAVAAVPVGTNPKTRDSRLFRSMGEYLRRSAATIIRIYTMYKPLKAFLLLALVMFLAGTGLGVRFLYYHFTEPNAGHVQSLILAAVFLIAGFMVGTVGLLADLVGANRKLLEDAIIRLRRLEFGGPTPGQAAGRIPGPQGTGEISGQSPSPAPNAADEAPAPNAAEEAPAPPSAPTQST